MGDKGELLEQILDDSSQMIQVSDAESFSMLYANKLARTYTGHGDEPYEGKHCYEYMMGRTTPCEFCPMHQIGEQDSFESEVDNGREIYAVKTKKINWHGREAFIEYAWDITNIRKSQKIYEARLHSLISAIADAQGIFHMDITEDCIISIAGNSKCVLTMGHVAHVDGMVRELTKYIPDMEQRQPFFDFFCKESLIKAYQEGKTELNRETMSIYDDDSIRPARITARLMSNPHTNHLECILFGLDISEEWQERKQHEKEIKEQLAVFNALADGYANVFLVDLRHDIVRILKLDGYVTTGMVKESAMNYSYTGMTRQYISERVHPQDKDYMYDAMAIGQVEKHLAVSKDYIGSYRVRINKETHYYQFKYIRLQEVDYVIAGFQNIDDTVRELQESKSKMEALAMDYTAVFFCDLKKDTMEPIKEKDFAHAKLNQRYTDRYSRWIKHSVDNIIIKESAPDFLDKFSNGPLMEYLSTHESLIARHKTKPNAAGMEYFEARAVLLYHDEESFQIILAYRSIDELVAEEHKQRQKMALALAAAEQSNRAKTTFLNSMSHDIRTPMNAIIGFASLAQAHIDDTRQVQDYLAKINTSSTHLLNLINDILDMSRIESGTVKLEEKPVNIPELLRDLRAMIQGLANSRQQNLRIDAQNIQNEDIMVDKLRLNQVLINILSNAIKFTPIGGNIEIRLVEKPCEKTSHATYEFSIKDNGMGMSPEFLRHVFDTFTREHSATVSGIQGTGLGMAITKNIVDMMGGKIQVESQEGKGTRFDVILTFRLADSAADKQEAEAPDSYDFAGRRILLVEDNELNREIAATILEDMGIQVDTAADGAEAVNIIHREPDDKYDLIFMDIQMPKMDGYMATREIRTLKNNKKANIPIVAMTANAFEKDKRKAMESGMNGHIGKPLDIELMKRTMAEIFKS